MFETKVETPIAASIVVIVLLTFVVAYQFTSLQGTSAIAQRDIELAVKQTRSADLDLEIARLSKPGETPVTIPPEKRTTPQTPAETVNCLLCHDLEQLKTFHFPERIMKIEAAKGMRQRICINCHGPTAEGTGTPDPEDPYPGDNSHPHRIHQSKLDSGEITCKTCHEYEGEIRFPKPKDGQLLVCELCHANGNFITIHIDGKILEDAAVDPQWIVEGDRHRCQECHWGDVVGIHKRATAQLGKV